LGCAGLIKSVRGDDWPQWRGPKRDGIWNESGLVDKFADKQLKLRWRVPLRSGYSGPTVADGRVYVTDRSADPKQIERVLCLDWKTGDTIWTHTYDCPYEGVGYTAGPRASVTIDDKVAYSLGAMGHLFAFDAADGRILWQKDLNKQYEIRMPIWGIAASPLVYKNLVIVEPGGEEACIVAFDKKTGEEKWKALADNAGYSAPILIQQAGRDVVVFWTGENVVGLDPLTGEVHWQHPFKPTRMVINITTPVLYCNQLFVSSFYDGSLMLKLAIDKLAVEQVWRRLGRDEQHTESLHCMIGTPILTGGYVYGVDSYGELRCLDAKTGDRIWENLEAVPKARWGTIHMVRNGGRVWMFNERGQLLIGRLSPDGFKEISRTQLIEPTRVQLPERGGVCWSHPAFAYKHVFARNDEALVCASLAADSN
jgi:outer membrane protein assembly factor BamB